LASGNVPCNQLTEEEFEPGLPGTITPLEGGNEEQPEREIPLVGRTLRSQLEERETNAHRERQRERERERERE
jgi:hypothetical protein